jgi:homocysteine S-methyltransferase
MPRYRHALPQCGTASFLTDGGLETVLVFDRGIDLPLFAAFPLLDTPGGRAELRSYYEAFLDLARRHRTGFILDTPTWRANPDWAPQLGYSLDALRRVNRDAVAFVAALRDAYDGHENPCVINGVLGPRGDGYGPGIVDPAAAEDYHGLQVETFAATEADMVSAVTMNSAGEAIGIARAARAFGIPSVVSFTVETDGRLVDGSSLRAAVEAVEEATDAAPAYYMVNCAHPTHFAGALERGEAWAARIRGVRANASTKSHAELDESTTLDAGDPQDLGRRYRGLRDDFPALSVLGGCCGTDHRHVHAIADACLRPAA